MQSPQIQVLGKGQCSTTLLLLDARYLLVSYVYCNDQSSTESRHIECKANLSTASIRIATACAEDGSASDPIPNLPWHLRHRHSLLSRQDVRRSGQRIWSGNARL